MTAPLVVPLTARRGSLTIRVAPLFCGTIVLLLVGNLGRIPVFSTGGRDVPILITDLAVAALIVVGGLAMASHRVFRLDAVAAYALLFAGLGAISAMLAIPRFGLSPFEAIVSLGYLARWLFYFGVYLVAINTLRSDDVDSVWQALEWTILLFAAFGIFQSAFLPGFAQMVYPTSRPYLDWDIQGRRLVSTFLDPNFAGAFIDIGLVVCFARLAARERVGSWKLLVLGVALVLTASRSSILALFVGALTIVMISGLSKQAVRAIIAGLILLVAALPKLLVFAKAYHKLGIDDPSALARVTVWLRGWTVFKDHWLIGVGFNTWGYVAERYGWVTAIAANYAIDGGLLFVTVMTGLAGLALFVAMLWSIFSASRRVWRDPLASAKQRGLAIGAAASIPTIVVHSLFTNSLMQPFLMEALWVLWALPHVALRRTTTTH
ncbi:MAG TPA: O-antigen ligase family protein [Gemmatimonadaceae bacterium]|jgi:hypothetical protein